MAGNMVLIHTDGGSRGNPGPAGIGAVIVCGGQKKEYYEYIGDQRTNNEAEYEALVFALKKTKALLGGQKAKSSEVVCYSDSELMVKQLNHEYKLKEERIQRYFIEIWNLSLDFRAIKFMHVPREENREADRLANKAMDEADSHSPRLL